MWRYKGLVILPHSIQSISEGLNPLKNILEDKGFHWEFFTAQFLPLPVLFPSLCLPFPSHRRWPLEHSLWTSCLLIWLSLALWGSQPVPSSLHDFSLEHYFFIFLLLNKAIIYKIKKFYDLPSFYFLHIEKIHDLPSCLLHFLFLDQLARNGKIKRLKEWEQKEHRWEPDSVLGRQDWDKFVLASVSLFFAIFSFFQPLPPRDTLSRVLTVWLLLSQESKSFSLRCVDRTSHSP